MVIDDLAVLWDQGYVPTAHQLHAALQLAGVLPREGIPIRELRASYPHLPSDGLFTRSDFRLGEEILVCSGLAERDAQRVRLCDDVGEVMATRDEHALASVLAAYLEQVPPPWLGAATQQGDVALERVPKDALQAMATTLTTPEDREALLLQLGRKYDDSYQRELGIAGEIAVVDACRRHLSESGHRDLAADVEHVSRRSDALGYDVRSPALDATPRRLEVKTLARDEEPPRVLISRNESERAKGDPFWRLVVCRRTSNGCVTIVGWCAGTPLLPLLPSDTVGGRWTQAALSLPNGVLAPGLPLGAGQ